VMVAVHVIFACSSSVTRSFTAWNREASHVRRIKARTRELAVTTIYAENGMCRSFALHPICAKQNRVCHSYKYASYVTVTRRKFRYPKGIASAPSHSFHDPFFSVSASLVSHNLIGDTILLSINRMLHDMGQFAGLRYSRIARTCTRSVYVYFESLSIVWEQYEF